MNEFLRDPDFAKTMPAQSLRQSGLGFIDVGVRGGIHPLLDPVAGLSEVLAFEPDAAESRLLRSQYAASADWKGVTIEETALSDTSGLSTLYVTSALTNSSLRPVDKSFIDRYNMVKFEPTGSEPVTTALLDDVLLRYPKSPQFGEFMKLDTQGTEFEILKGAIKTLSERTVALLVEVWFCSPYQDQKLFSEVELYLRSLGFSCYGTSLHYRSCKLLDKRNEVSRERPLWGDAVFLKDPLGTPAKLSDRQVHVLFVCAVLLGFHDFAIELAVATWADGAERDRVLRFIKRQSRVSVWRSTLDALSLAARVCANPWRSNITVGKFVEKRRDTCSYEEVP